MSKNEGEKFWRKLFHIFAAHFGSSISFQDITSKYLP